MSKNYLLDTNILVHLIRGDNTGKKIADFFGLWDESVHIQISVVTVGEMLSLAKQFNWGKEKLRITMEILGHIDVLDIRDEHVPHIYADLDSYSRGSGRKMGKNDVWIAATAKVHSLLLLTTDKDFDHLHPSRIDRVVLDQETGLPK